MKILCCVLHEYYGLPGTVNHSYNYFVETLREMGHRVHNFDYGHQSFDRGAMNDFFLSIVKHGAYDMVFIALREDEFFPEVLDEAKHHTVLLAWNTDDDMHWADYSSQYCPHFTYMVTTYSHVYEANKAAHPNLLLSQWGCTGHYDGLTTRKDIDFGFVGKLYSTRAKEITRIRRHLPLVANGMGFGIPLNLRGKLTRWMIAKLGISCSKESSILADEAAVKGIWNRTKISYTPLESWVEGCLQIKARVFDMGLSGTVMLCSKNPALYEFYEPGRDYVEFDSVDDCISKAKFLLRHEKERCWIAEAYYKRTRAEHMWSHRFEKLFAEIGLPT